MTPLPAQQMSDVDRLVADLRRSSVEIASAGYNGWGNVCSDAADLIERLRSEREGLRKDAERWKNLHLPENTDALAEAALSVIVYDMGAFGTMLSAMSEDDRRDMKSGIALAVRRAALAATHADEAKGE